MPGRITWELDTCGCVIQLDWTEDPITGGFDYTPTPGGRIRRCEAHADLTRAQVLAMVRDENTRKGYIIDQLQTRLGDRPYEYQFVKEGDTRRMILTIWTITETQRLNIQSRADARFGSGRITVVVGI